ncbi:hypothetical protein MJT46_019155 [Ovis ammon polii x Ovis aries]|nr:hypothetical protein MJT46_019155 [Ovis ammon polii x Ovis aries]
MVVTKASLPIAVMKSHSCDVMVTMTSWSSILALFMMRPGVTRTVLHSDWLNQPACRVLSVGEIYRATKSPVAVPTVLGHEIQLGADHAEMWSSLEQEQDQLIAEVKKQLELEKWQAVDETKK